ncbi:MAG: hypothetical protein ACE1Y2_02450, partial [Stenotrophomonas maltophilia]
LLIIVESDGYRLGLDNLLCQWDRARHHLSSPFYRTANRPCTKHAMTCWLENVVRARASS